MGNALVTSATIQLKDRGAPPWGSVPSSEGPTSTPNLFYDGFETGDLTAPNGPSPALNTTGFTWGAPTRTSIVTIDPSCGGLVYGDATSIYNGSPICNGPIADRDYWAAKSGKNSMRFRYEAGIEQTEQRFALNNQDDLWIRYWLRVPDNYVKQSLNDKFLATYSVNHDDDGEITWQLRPGTGTDVNIVVQDGGVAAGEALSALLFDGFADRGRYMQLVFRRKTPTGVGTNDGIIQMWRRWDGESTFTKLQEKLDASAYSVADPGCGGGFVLGWTNDPFDVDTEFMMDNFELSTESLI